MRRRLKGSLENLGLAALFRLLGATGASGQLEVESPAGSFSLRMSRGRVEQPGNAAMGMICACLGQASGTFNFEPEDPPASLAESVALSSLPELCRQGSTSERKPFASDVDVENLLAEELNRGSAADDARIHLLPPAAPEHPLEDLLDELEEVAPEELLFAQVGVVTTDPRPWRGWMEREWRHRGWELVAFGTAPDVPLERLDGLVIHHRLSVTRVGHEDEWLELLHRATGGERPIPVVWVGPLGDPVWVARLVEAGASFLLPAPAGEGGETWRRFRETVTRVVARLLHTAPQSRGGAVGPASMELVEALVRGSDPGEKIGVLLQIASGTLRSGAVLSVEETSIRCRAGFGFPLSKAAVGLPRGIAFLERVIRGEEGVGAVDPEAAGARQLARVLGVERLPSGMVVIPLEGQGRTVGLLAGQRKPGPEADLEELVLLARRMGGALLGS